jgi:hypothetical protein
MLPLIIGLMLVGGLIIASSSDGKEEEIKFSDGSNCSNEFIAFSENLSITRSKKQQLISSRDTLQKKIKDHFSAKTSTPSPTFYIQGSYKQGTLIRKQNDTCDIDVGIYFNKKPTITPLALHNNVVAAVGEHTNEKATIKSKCVRIYYANQFHIDLPVYYKESNKYFIAIGGSGWREDDPKVFTNWLKEEVKNDPQKIRVIKYFKAWADFTKNTLGQKMPSGLALTLWVLKHFQGDKREDLAFLKTAISLKNYLSKTSKSNWECIMPTVPGDNAIEKLKEDQRGNFLAALNTLVTQGVKTASSSSKDESLKFWKSSFGKWF